ncbi:transcription factor S-II, central domain-containing protein [Tirmania nivea]|nr:transcription factor S-II, central domain-containing protein [Tirmania nivea]
MNASEIRTRITDLEKASKDNLPAERFIEILNSLRNEIKITEKLLRETKVGIAVNKLRQHSNKAVADLAKDTVARWKSEVKGNGKPKSDAAAPSPQKKVAPEATAKNATTAVPEQQRKSVSAQGGTGGRSKETDKVAWKCLSDPVRDNCLGMIYDGLCFEAALEVESSKIFSRAKAVEAAVYTASKRTDQAYKTKIRSLYLNLKDKKNPYLRRRVINGDLSPERLSTMTSQEMASEERRAEDQKLEEENMREAMKPTAVRSTTDQFPCGKCGKRTVAYSQAQTRSADEPMTTFCECQNCGHRWKFC